MNCRWTEYKVKPTTEEQKVAFQAQVCLFQFNWSYLLITDAGHSSLAVHVAVAKHGGELACNTVSDGFAHRLWQFLLDYFLEPTGPWL